MKFTQTALAGVWLVELEPREDERGFFARAFDPAAFSARGLDAALAQLNVSRNARKGTMRGLHWQEAPHEEAKLVRCARGSIHDVAVDVRPGSPTRGRWTSATLDAGSGKALYIPKGFAHGFLTLEDDAEVHYLMTDDYAPSSARGMRWDDPILAGAWPFPPASVAPKDLAWPPFNP